LLRALAFVSPTTSVARLMHAAAGLVTLGPGEALVLWTVPLIHAIVFSVLLARRVGKPL
jgi:hypothetical protein